MRRGYLLVPALLAFSAVQAAMQAQMPRETQTQIQTPRRAPDGRVFDVVGTTKAANTQSSASLDDVVARLMWFDRDRDEKIAIDELPERMENLVAFGDVDGDAALDTGEIKTMARTPRPAVVQGVAGHAFGGSVYGFADDVGFSSSRSHVEGVIADLRLTPSRQERATAVATTFLVDAEAQRRETLLEEMEQVLAPTDLLRFTQTLDTIENRRRAVVEADNVRRVLFAAGPGLQALLGQFSLAPEPRARALEAVKRFESHSRLDDAEQAALVAQMSDVLEREERDNFRAALARRPLVQKGGILFKRAGNVVRSGSEIQFNPGLRNALFIQR